MNVQEIIAEIKQKLEPKGGLKHVFFVGCGGSKAAIFPGLYLLQSEAKTFGASTYTSNEFVHATPKELDERCIAVICSLKATAETVEAVKVANKVGAITIAMTGNMQTGMAKVGQYVVTYSNGDDQVYSDSNQANALRIGFELLHQFEGWENYGKAMAAYQNIDTIVAEGKAECLPLPRPGQKRKRMSRCSTYWLLAPTSVWPILCAAATLWKCSGSMPSACIPVNTSMVRLRPRTKTCP